MDWVHYTLKVLPFLGPLFGIEAVIGNERTMQLERKLVEWSLELGRFFIPSLILGLGWLLAIGLILFVDILQSLMMSVFHTTPIGSVVLSVSFLLSKWNYIQCEYIHSRLRKLCVKWEYQFSRKVPWPFHVFTRDYHMPHVYWMINVSPIIIVFYSVVLPLLVFILWLALLPIFCIAWLNDKFESKKSIFSIIAWVLSVFGLILSGFTTE